ncbi:unnamed protein product [Sordaria macrospora k-hell]|uniref:WGS project CABT00000000 data, contig 2.7 n=1 Tax=Sordaria macrospora (strain ATCC MYA-333 / DSM 997 / K(L3346) / K-hell) TaxID=771870 RepID=F7VU44_SORMK|nr:uncharacterized protein SMAC_03139 [Sordaria macrospora k-hell]CCC09032.1 unnamed protein product [Sordaria macrospora k-hell]
MADLESWTANPDADLKLEELKGGENFEKWNRYVLDVFRIFGLEGFVKGTETPPPSDTDEDKSDLRVFHERRLCAFRVIHNSSRAIHSRLRGYSFDCIRLPDDLDPKALWDAIHRWDLAVHLGTYGKIKLLELSHIHHSQFGNLNEYMRRADWLRRRLQRAGVPIADELMKTYVLSGLTSYPDETWAMLVAIKAEDWTYFDLRKIPTNRCPWEFSGSIEPRQTSHNISRATTLPAEVIQDMLAGRVPENAPLLTKETAGFVQSELSSWPCLLGNHSSFSWALWEAVARWNLEIPYFKKSRLLREFSNIDRDEFDSLDAYSLKASWYNHRLNELSIALPEEVQMAFVIQGLRNHHLEWAIAMSLRIEDGKHTFRTHLTEVLGLKDHETRLKEIHGKSTTDATLRRNDNNSDQKSRQNKKRCRNTQGRRQQHNGMTKQHSTRH